MKILATSYPAPDLDGTACAYGYAELKKAQGEDVVIAFLGEPHREAQFVFDTFGIERTYQNTKDVIDTVDGVALLDASDNAALQDVIPAEKVIEVVDHRKIRDDLLFSKAQIDIALIGAAASMIAERFKEANVDPSAHVAALLYSAIVSNTVNFQSGTTHERDRVISEWLLQFFDCPENYVRKMFEAKSSFGDWSMKRVLDEDLMHRVFGKTRVGIAQLEIVDVPQLFTSRKDELISAMQAIQEENKIDCFFLTAVDIMDGFNQFLVIDDVGQKMIETILNVEFTDRVARQEGVMMRKQIIPLITEYYQVERYN